MEANWDTRIEWKTENRKAAWQMTWTLRSTKNGPKNEDLPKSYKKNWSHKRALWVWMRIRTAACRIFICGFPASLSSSSADQNHNSDSATCNLLLFLLLWYFILLQRRQRRHNLFFIILFLFSSSCCLACLSNCPLYLLYNPYTHPHVLTPGVLPKSDSRIFKFTAAAL